MRLSVRGAPHLFPWQWRLQWGGGGGANAFKPPQSGGRNHKWPVGTIFFWLQVGVILFSAAHFCRNASTKKMVFCVIFFFAVNVSTKRFLCTCVYRKNKNTRLTTYTKASSDTSIGRLSLAKRRHTNRMNERLAINRRRLVVNRQRLAATGRPRGLS